MGTNHSHNNDPNAESEHSFFTHYVYKYTIQQSNF